MSTSTAQIGWQPAQYATSHQRHKARTGNVAATMVCTMKALTPAPKVPKLGSTGVAKIAAQLVDEGGIPARSVSMLKTTMMLCPDCWNTADVNRGESQKTNSVEAKASGLAASATDRNVSTDLPLQQPHSIGQRSGSWMKRQANEASKGHSTYSAENSQDVQSGGVIRSSVAVALLLMTEKDTPISPMVTSKSLSDLTGMLVTRA